MGGVDEMRQHHEAVLQLTQAIQRLFSGFAVMGLYATIVAWWAAARGYPTGRWWAASFLTTPGITLCLLSALPDRSIDARRARRRRELEAELAGATPGVRAEAPRDPRDTIGDEMTWLD
jgi:hypothetical protein